MGPKKKKGEGEGGKGKSSKLTKMNEMDRVKYLERRLAEEEEGRRRKEDMVSGYLRLKLENEERSVFINSAKITEQWRSILRRAKTLDLRRDVSTLKEAFERALEKKTTYIQSLLVELEQAEEQYAMAFRSEIEAMNKLMKVQEDRLVSQLNVFSSYRDSLVNRAKGDRDEMVARQKTSEEYLNDVQIAIEQRHNELESVLRSDFQGRKDEIRNRNLEEITSLKNSMEETIEALWLQLHDHIKQYRDSTADKRRTYKDLLHKDKKGVMDLKVNNSNISKLQDEIGDLRKSVSEGGEEGGDETSQLRKEKDTMTHNLHQTRRSVSVVLRNREHGKLRCLAVESDRTLTELKTLCDEQEQLLKLHKLSQKLATKQDIAFSMFNPSDAFLSQEEQIAMKELDDGMWNPNLDIPVSLRNLEPLWRKLNKADLDFVALKRENKSQDIENKTLRHYLKQYIELASSQGDNIAEEGMKKR